MTCNILATGSGGNAALLNNTMLIDCGVPYKKLASDPETVRRLKIVFLTHQHGDHVNPATLKRLHRERPSLRFACGPWMVGYLTDLGIPPGVIDFFDSDEWFAYSDGLKVRCIPIPHDVPNCAWDIEAGGESVFYATDCGSLDGVFAPHRDLYLVEGNYGEAEMEERIRRKQENGDFAYELRAREYHLSEEQAMRFLAENAGPESKYLLIHRHIEG